MIIENLEIAISSNATSAADGIKKLTAALRGLYKVSTDEKIKTLSANLAELSATLNGISDGAIGKLNNLAFALQKISDMRGNLGFTKKDMSGVQRMTDAANYTSPTPNKDVYYGILREAMAQKKISGAAMSSIKNLYQSGDAEGLKNLHDGLVAVDSEFKKKPKDAGKAKKAFTDVGDGSKKAEGKLKKFWKSANRIAEYRLLRAALKAITQALKEGTKNLILWEAATGRASSIDSFNFKISQVRTNLYELKNQFGSLAGELLDSVDYALNPLIESFKDVLEFLTQFVAAFNGKSTYLRAKDIEYGTEAWQDYAEAIVAAKNELLGIDELNIVGSNSGLNDIANSFDLFEEAQLPWYLQSFAKWMSDDTGETKRLVAELGLLGFIAYKVGKKLFGKGDALKKETGQTAEDMETSLALEGVLQKVGVGAGALGITIGLLSGLFGDHTTATENASDAVLTFKDEVDAVSSDSFATAMGEVHDALDQAKTDLSNLRTEFSSLSDAMSDDSFATDFGQALADVQTKIDAVADSIVNATTKVQDFYDTVNNGGYKPRNLFEGGITPSKVYSMQSELEADPTVPTKAIVTAAQEAGTSAGMTFVRAFNTVLADARNRFIGVNSALRDAMSANAQNIFGGNTSSNATKAPYGYTSNGKPVLFKSSTFNDALKLSGEIGAGLVMGSLVGHALKALGVDFTSFFTPKAKGGPVATGTLFLAGEAGAEIIASSGGHTSVSNTDQIAESVESGNGVVVNAVMAMANMVIRAINDKDTATYIDGKKVSRALYNSNQQVEQSRGSNLVRRGALI